MSKRTRGTGRAHRRPGTRPPSERSASTRRRVAVDSPIEQALDATAADGVEDQPVESAAQPAAEVERVTRHPRTRVKAGSLLATRAESEYVYVAQDMRRILVVSAVLLGTLIVLWLLLVVLRVVELPFY